MPDESANILAFDVETTGLSIEKDEIIEICLRKGIGEDAEVIVHRFKPTVSITPGAFDTHGISDEDLADCSSFSDHSDEIVAALEWARVIVGYNVRFDLAMLESAFKKTGRVIDFGQKVVVDPLRLWQGAEPRKLENAVARFLGEPLDDAHSAEADITATARLLPAVVREFGLEGKSWEDLQGLCFPDLGTWIGPTNHFVWHGDVVVFGFGKYKGTPVLEVAEHWPDYLKWIQGKDFPPHVENICKGALQGLGEAEFHQRIANHFGDASHR